MAPQSNLFGMPGEELGDILLFLLVVVFALGFSIFIGVISGLLPANRAARPSITSTSTGIGDEI